MKKRAFNRYDLKWTLSLFGTAVGAGILFLPIRAGTNGVWPIIFMSIIIFPMTFLSHRALSRFVSASNIKNSDITEVVSEYFGEKWGFAINLLYFFAFYPVCLAYSVGLTNTAESFLVNQVGVGEVSRLFLGFIISVFLMGVMIFNEELVAKVCEILVYPLCALLLFFSLYLIPHWNMSTFSILPSIKDFISVVWLTLPVLVFSFEYTPAISTFTLSIKRRYGKFSDFKCNKILFLNSSLLLFFVMFFVLSCTLCLNENDFTEARIQNIPIVSYFANKLNNPLIEYIGPIIAFLAISTSFFGHYFGAREGMEALLKKATKIYKITRLNSKKTTEFGDFFVFVTMVLAAWLNPSILGFLEAIGGPVIAAILFILPMIGVYKVKSMAKYKNTLADVFIIVTGLMTIFSTIYKLIIS